jgi:hypothetical protein
VNTVPDKCPFCESPIMVHGGNLLRSEDGGFATYECKTEQDVGWPDDQWKRTGQKERCRRREVQLLMKQRDEARGRIKRLEEALGCVVESCDYLHHRKKHQHGSGEPCPVEELIRKAKEAKP